jgi:hypothetical protein
VAAQLDWQVSGNEFSGLVGWTGPGAAGECPKLSGTKPTEILSDLAFDDEAVAAPAFAVGNG